MSDDVRHKPDSSEPNEPEPERPEIDGPENDAVEAEAASAAAASDTFEQAGGVEEDFQDHEAQPDADEDIVSEATPEPAAKLERLQKILAQAGIASRRHAEELITEGRVQVNGKIVTELGSKADPARDHIRVDGKLLQGSERHRYFVLNKPKGFVTTVSDPEGRPTVMQFFAKMRERLYPVGRLDYMSEGLLLVTNDGELANKLTRAASGVEKTYLVKVSGQPSEEDLERLRQGVSVDRGKPGSKRVQTAPAEIHRFRPGKTRNERQAGRPRTGENPWFEVVLIEGRNRELRKMFEEIGHHVEKIRRIGYGPLVLDLEPGKLRELEPEEVENLRKAADGKYRKPKAREPRHGGDERRFEKPRRNQRQPETGPKFAGPQDRGKFRREAGESGGKFRGEREQRFGSDRKPTAKSGQFGSRNRTTQGRFNDRRQDAPPRRGDRPFGESRQRPERFTGDRPQRREPSRPFGGTQEGRGRFAEEQPRERGPKKFGPRPPRPGFGAAGRAESGRPGRPSFRPENRERSGPSKPFRRDREERPQFGRPGREESGSGPREERRQRPGQAKSGRPDRGSSSPGGGGFRRGRSGGLGGKSSGPGRSSGGFGGRSGGFRGKSGSVRPGGRGRSGPRPGGKPGGGKRRP